MMQTQKRFLYVLTAQLYVFLFGVPFTTVSSPLIHRHLVQTITFSAVSANGAPSSGSHEQTSHFDPWSLNEDGIDCKSYKLHARLFSRKDRSNGEDNDRRRKWKHRSSTKPAMGLRPSMPAKYAQQGDTIRIIKDFTPILNLPGSDDDLVAFGIKGQHYPVEAVDEGWIEIAYRGVPGWIKMESCVRIVTARRGDTNPPVEKTDEKKPVSGAKSQKAARKRKQTARKHAQRNTPSPDTRTPPSAESLSDSSQDSVGRVSTKAESPLNNHVGTLSTANGPLPRSLSPAPGGSTTSVPGALSGRRSSQSNGALNTYRQNVSQAFAIFLFLSIVMLFTMLFVGRRYLLRTRKSGRTERRSIPGKPSLANSRQSKARTCFIVSKSLATIRMKSSKDKDMLTYWRDNGFSVRRFTSMRKAVATLGVSIPDVIALDWHCVNKQRSHLFKIFGNKNIRTRSRIIFYNVSENLLPEARERIPSAEFLPARLTEGDMEKLTPVEAGQWRGETVENANGRGSVEGPIERGTIAEVMQYIEATQKSGHLMVGSNGNGGVVLFREGAIVYAATGQQQGKEAVHGILDAKQGSFCFVNNSGLNGREERLSVTGTLLEWTRSRNESAVVQSK
ncbi:MAG: DUF4388 domain-containing protein [Chitinivibrionales bacterium]|nr:DUF4388 domain-containing protein [Chitinivibrionales bacterium]MBD3357012.1 DUF4388 domain-containing protein [Chitinivibrionales bacterium]